MLFLILMFDGPTPGQPQATPAEAKAYLGLVIRHLGAEDRSVSPLLLVGAEAQEKLRRCFPEYRQGYEWLAVPEAAFQALTGALAREFFARGVSDADLSRPGSYSFVLLQAGGRQELRCNPQHSATLLSRSLELLPPGPAAAALQRRLAITRLSSP